MKKIILILLLALTGCRLLTPRPSAQPLSDSEGGLLVYLQPWPQDASRLSVTVTSMAAVRTDGVVTPLELAMNELPGADGSRQRLLATGRLPPGTYRGLELVVGRATLVGAEGASQLLVGREPAPVQVSFDVVGGRETVVTATLRSERSLEGGFQFTPQLAAAVPSRPTPSLIGACTNTGANDVTLFDKRRHEVYGAIATGRAPVGSVLSAASNRLFVADSGEDQIRVQDLVSMRDLPPVRLVPGDRPREVALSPDGRVLVVVNGGSNTLAFVDVSSGQEIGRAPTGNAPASLLVDRSWRRAYVLNDQSSTITVVDLGARSVVGTIGTDPSPIRAQLDRAGKRLYVIHRASPQMNVYSLPDLTLVRQVLVGLGASALKVDPRSDLVYVAKRSDRRIAVYDPFSLIPIDSFDVTGGVAWLAIDDTENAMLAVVPSRREVVAVDLASRGVVGAIPVGEEPYMVTVVGERY